MSVDHIHAALDTIDTTPRESFLGELEDQLVAAWLTDDERDVNPLSPADGEDVPHTEHWRRRWLLVAAATIVVLALGLLAIAAVQGPDSVQTDTVPDTPAPSVSPATTSMLLPVESSPVTLPATTTPAPATTAVMVTEGSPPVVNGWAAFVSGSNDGSSDVYLVRDGDAPHRLVVEGSDTGSELCPAFSPDGERLMFWSGIGNPTDWYHDGELVVLTVADDGSVMPLTTVPLDGGVDPTCATWAPDGRWIAFADGGAVSVADTTTGEVRRLVDYTPSDLEWRPGTDELAIAGKVETVEEMLGWSNGPLVVYSVATGQTRTFGDLEVRDIAWSPDGKTLAYTRYFLHGGDCIECTSGISLVDADGSNERSLTTTHHRAYRSSEITIQWSPRGDLIAYGRPCGAACHPHDTEIVLVTATDDDPTNPIGTETILAPPVTETAGDLGQWYPASFSWAPDGTGLLYQSPPGQFTPRGGLVIVPIDSDQPPQELTDGIEFNPAPVSFSPDLRTQQWARA